VDFIQLTIDGKSVNVPPATSVLEAARQVGVKIPTLCHLADLTPTGACRVCVVEIDGMKNLAASCSMPVSSGMSVHTHTPAVLEARRMVLELMLANHPADCFACARNLNCELQELAAELGVKKVRFDGERRRYPIDDRNPFIVRDNEKCILCGRCVRACQELQVCNVLDFTGRGFDTKLAPAFDTATNESDCVFCGACVSACPVGALTEKVLCQSGRPDKKVRTTCPFCGVGCNFDLNVKDGKVIGVTSAPDSPVNGRLLCVKGRFGIDYIHSPQRLTTPLIRKNDKLEPATWDEALNLVAQRFKKIKAEHGPDSLAALSSARCTNEENYVLQKFMRAAIGTNSVDHCART
jgi:formate dehydrogenase alpha subunit